MGIKWKYIKKLESENLIQAFETETDYKFEDAFKACVSENNGGRPSPNVFDTENTKGRTFKSLLSFNASDTSNVRAFNDSAGDDIGEKYIAFATDDFGNLICFERASGRVVFWNHETGVVEPVADGFDMFINKLYAAE
jgi:hypothetical protein